MVRITNIHKSFDDLLVLNGLDMCFEEGEITAILGPSGCGKTTLLNIIAGLETADKGEIYGMEQKTPGYLFQEPRLMPWKNAVDNLKFVLPDSMDKSLKNEICIDMLKKVGLSGFEKQYPSRLSGGMNRRLAIARAFIVNSDILFMDEPFQSLDLKRRQQMIELLKSLWVNQKTTILLVTHDVQEALLLSDKIYILSDKPAKVVEEVKNPMPFESRGINNENFYRLEQKIINQYLMV